MFTEDTSNSFLIPHGHTTTIYEKKELDWSNSFSEALDAAHTYKYKLVEYPVLAFLQIHRPYIIDTGASEYAGAVFLQQ